MALYFRLENARELARAPDRIQTGANGGKRGMDSPFSLLSPVEPQPDAARIGPAERGQSCPQQLGIWVGLLDAIQAGQLRRLLRTRMSARRFRGGIGPPLME
jgi:hypothetical protein